ncbi:MAG: LiaI-LiaF-like domain-containing protein [Bacteroidota bacterium]
MDKQQINKVPIFGIILVMVGAGLLLRQMNIIRIDGKSMLLFGFVAYGAAMIIRSFVMNIRQSLFIGSVSFFSGVLLVLGHYELIEPTAYVYVPGFLMTFGLSFLMLFIFNYKDFHLLLPATIFIGLGIAFMMTEIGYLYPSDVKEAIQQYWPVAIILFGVLMLFRRKDPK